MGCDTFELNLLSRLKMARIDHFLSSAYVASPGPTSRNHGVFFILYPIFEASNWLRPWSHYASKCNRKIQNIPEHKRLREFVLFQLSTTWLNSTVRGSAPRLLTRQLYSKVYNTFVLTAAPDTALELLDFFLLRTTQIDFLIRNSAGILA